MKSPEQQIVEARAALGRALARQKREDTHQKIVVGATAWRWLCANPRAAQSFIQHVQGSEIRAQDKTALESAIGELQKIAPPQTPQPSPVSN